jgi:hypothetical protein
MDADAHPSQLFTEATPITGGNTVSTRRTARHNDLGVRLCEETGTVTTSRSRAEAHREAALTRAMGSMIRR